MDQHKQVVLSKRYDKVLENLQKNGMEAILLASKAEVLEKLKELIPAGAAVAHGGSMTLAECGVIKWLKAGSFCYLDRDKPGLSPEERTELMRRALLADVYLSSVNALTEQGELYCVDGTGNRVAALLYGPRQVILVVGVNKIVPDLKAAEVRVKKIACPANTVRLNCPTYCREKGECRAFLDGNPSLTSGCGKTSICNDFVVMKNQRPGRITVLLVTEELGY